MELKQALKIIKEIGESTTNGEVKITFNDKNEVDSMRIPLDDSSLEFLYAITKVLYPTGYDFQFVGNALLYTDYIKSEPEAVVQVTAKKEEAKP